MKLSEIKANPNNPRIINDDKFNKLKKSIEDFPKMMDLRPIVVDVHNMVLGGNMRLKALEDLGYKEIPDKWVKRADDLTEDEKKEFIIKDNVGFGEWEWEMLANEWNVDDLTNWGLDIPMDCLYGWKEGAAHNWYSDRKQTTILEFDRPTRNQEHPTMKPIPLIAYQIENSSKVGDIVADGFGGSGTTMVASDKLRRKCYMIELSPKYCQVIIDRMRALVPEIVIKKNGIEI